MFKKTNDISNIPQDGNIYTDGVKYAVILNGRYISGGIGKIIRKNPTKIKKCKFEKCKMYPKCNYYHPEKKEARNYFITSSALKILDEDTYKTFFDEIPKEEREQYFDRVFHEFIISLSVLFVNSN